MAKIGIKEAASMIGRHHLTLRRWIKNGQMPRPAPLDPRNPRSPLLFDCEEIERFITEQTERGFLR
jgi:hypothetical protein